MTDAVVPPHLSRQHAKDFNFLTVINEEATNTWGVPRGYDIQLGSTDTRQVWAATSSVLPRTIAGHIVSPRSRHDLRASAPRAAPDRLHDRPLPFASRAA